MTGIKNILFLSLILFCTLSKLYSWLCLNYLILNQDHSFSPDLTQTILIRKDKFTNYFRLEAQATDVVMSFNTCTVKKVHNQISQKQFQKLKS